MIIVDDRAAFHRRARFAAITVGILALGLSLAELAQTAWNRAHRHVFCESYSPGYDPQGCSAVDRAAWKALGVKPVQEAEPPKS